MAIITNLTPTTIKPSDVFGYEVNTDVGYGRETFNITGATTAKPVRVGTILVVDYLANTATPLKQTDIATLADTATLVCLLVVTFLPTLLYHKTLTVLLKLLMVMVLLS